MRVISINQAAGQVDDGLAEIAIRGLKKIVVLAGPNGSGKSRLLRRIESRSIEKSNGIVLDGPLSQAPVTFVSLDLNLTDPESFRLSDLRMYAEGAKQPGVSSLVHSALPYIQRVQTEWWDTFNPRNELAKEARDNAVRNYEDLRSLILTVLNASLGRDREGQPTLFEKPIAQAQLSHGQRALLKWCVAQHAQGIHLNELILLMDEPENHLHPEAMISAIAGIAAVNKNGQIWIATHSVPLIAALYHTHRSELSLYFMQNGRISFAGEQPERVLTSLMGGEDNIEALREFIELPEVFATNRFAAECLTEPDVIFVGPASDPQNKIVSGDLDNSSSAMKLLDYGCGSGRLLNSLIAIYGQDLQKKISYVGWDCSDRTRGLCEQAIEGAYGESANRWFDDRQHFASIHSSGSFDRVVLCNVLHEISPIDWLSLFSERNVINQCLHDNGYLLIIEDYLMRKGECAHPFGFIVLDTEPLNKLFRAHSGKNRIVVKYERNRRIKGHFVPKQLLANVTKDSIEDSLLFARIYAQEQITSLRRSGGRDSKAGRAHGYWVQQYANITLALTQY